MEHASGPHTHVASWQLPGGVRPANTRQLQIGSIVAFPHTGARPHSTRLWLKRVSHSAMPAIVPGAAQRMKVRFFALRPPPAVEDPTPGNPGTTKDAAVVAAEKLEGDGGTGGDRGSVEVGGVEARAPMGKSTRRVMAAGRVHARMRKHLGPCHSFRLALRWFRFRARDSLV